MKNIIPKHEFTKEDKQKIQIGAVIATILAPFASLSAAIVFYSYKKLKFNPTFITVTSLAIAAIMTLIVSPQKLWNMQYESYSKIVEAFQGENTTSEIMSALAQQIPFSVTLGIIVGVIILWVFHKKSPAWQNEEYREDPYTLWKKKRFEASLANPANTPSSGGTLGVNESGELIIQTEDEAAAHTIVTGASGAGKTVTLLRQAHDYIKNGHGYAFVDLKGTPDIPHILKQYADMYDVPFAHFVIQNKEDYHGPADGPAYYDPLGRGDASRRKDLIMGMREWSEPYYKEIANSYLQTAFSIYLYNKSQQQSNWDQEPTNTFKEISAYLNPEKLRQAVLALDADDPKEARIIEGADTWFGAEASSLKNAMSAVESIRTQINSFTNSTAGQWLKEPEDQDDDLINFYNVAHNGGVAIFSLDSGTYSELSSSIASLILQDLLTVFSELLAEKPHYPFHVVVDEFSSIANSDAILALIGKAREAKMSITVATQSLSDLSRIGSDFANQVLGAAGSFIIHRTNLGDDAEKYASILGKQDSEENGKEEFIIKPSTLQKLKQGEVIFAAKHPDQRVEKVRVVRLNIAPPEMSYPKTQPKPQEQPKKVTIEELDALEEDISITPMRSTMNGETEQPFNNPLREKYGNTSPQDTKFNYSEEEHFNPTPTEKAETEKPVKEEKPSIFKTPKTSKETPIRPVKIPRPSDKNKQ